MSDTIVTFTLAALNHIKNNIQAQQAMGFRLAVKKTGCSGYAYVPAIVHQTQDSDLQLQVEEVRVFIDANSAKFLQGTVIDFVNQGLGQIQLIFRNPNATSLCGCGESFSVESNTEVT